MSVAAVVITFLALIGPRQHDGFAVTAVNDFTLQPVTAIYPRSLGAIPSFVAVNHSVPVERCGDLTSTTSLWPGELVKIYGYKLPPSRTVKAFRIEALDHGLSNCAPARATHFEEGQLQGLTVLTPTGRK